LDLLRKSALFWLVIAVSWIQPSRVIFLQKLIENPCRYHQTPGIVEFDPTLIAEDSK
jgi:hypothetical protein